MKRWALATLSLALLAGCSTPPAISWQQDNQVTVNQSVIELKSTLWVNQMPMVGEEETQSLHGSLYLSSNGELPASLTVNHLTIKQGEQQWNLSESNLEVRTHSENQWEVAFNWQGEFDMEKPVDIALQLENQATILWLVERKVAIDKVY
ncbi:hypothetical protein BOO29_03665 [Vibrio navarrensis]|uniref:hypothetical protein n=1 Tax=Vibrio navarrensis TaxID=29495 RepID=UPI00051D7707|nr:hypothetical protein [Vibrio navarrensis]KGK18966.1 DNA polymerase III subunit beta [Vibrio navarrensis]MBE4574598.1 hypothetical protein [Vibrio navarrensis]MBE4576252.1 hypothetical protein [Vibrio navarrensis]MBE4581193.1 hypothetical protein [Vibrio navarrensis]MBE4584082.1 hypothetical protein [Vibrio navarrensis]